MQLFVYLVLFPIKLTSSSLSNSSSWSEVFVSCFKKRRQIELWEQFYSKKQITMGSSDSSSSLSAAEMLMLMKLVSRMSARHSFNFILKI
jgi:hypothetical protein